MSFSSAKQHILTNAQAKEEKATLEQEHAGLRLKIKEAKNQADQIVDLSSDIEKQKDLLIAATKMVNDKMKEHQLVSKNVLAIKGDLDKSTKELGVVKDTHQTTISKITEAESRYELLQKSIKSAERQSDLIATKILEQNASLLNAQEDHAALIGKSSLLETQLKQAEDLHLTVIKEGEALIVAKSQATKELAELIEGSKELMAHKVIIEKSLDEAKMKTYKILEDGLVEATKIVEDAKDSITKRHKELDDREGAISLRETWNKTKQDKLKEIKASLEEHLGKTIEEYSGNKINIIFPD